jgi:hypothetical protein
MLHCFLPGSWVPPLQTPSAMPEVQSSGELALVPMLTWQLSYSMLSPATCCSLCGLPSCFVPH